MELVVKCSECDSTLQARIQVDAGDYSAWLEVEPCGKCKLKAAANAMGVDRILDNFLRGNAA